MKPKSKTAEIYLLVFLIAIESCGALFGGYNLMNDPTGESISLPIELLENSVFRNYSIPGIILFTVLGIFPLFLVYPLLSKPNWPPINLLNIYKHYHWAWTYSVYTAIILIIWINIQMLLLEGGSRIQGAFGLLGIIILIIALLPSVKRYYRLTTSTKHHS